MLEQAAAPALLRELRVGAHDPCTWPELPTITLALLVGDGELDSLRAYEAGTTTTCPPAPVAYTSAPSLQVVGRRSRGAIRRVHRVGPIELDTAARDVRGFRVPRRTRTVDSRACRLRRKLSEHGAQAVVNVCGVGCRFVSGEPPRP